MLSGITHETVITLFKNKDLDGILNLNKKKFKTPSKCFQIVIDSSDISFISFIKDLYGENVFSINHILSCCKTGDFHTVKWFHENTFIHFNKNVMDNALTSGHLEIAEWLLNNRLEGCSENILDDVIILNNNFKIIEWLINNHCKISENSLVLACNIGELDIINLILEKTKINFTFYHFKELIKSKNLVSIMKISFKYNFKIETEDIRDICIIYNVFDLLKLKFHSKLTNINNDIIINAYLSGHTELVKWIIKKTGIDYKLFDIAASKGDLEFVMWLDNKRFSATTKAFDAACINGHYMLVKFLSIKRTEGFSEEAVFGCLRENHIDIYQWLYTNYEKVRTNAYKYELFCKEHSLHYPRIGVN